MADRIITFGDVIDDIVAIPDGPIRDDTDTPSSIHSRPGGSAANTAAWLGSLGADSLLVGSVATADVARHTQLLAEVGAAADLHGSTELPTGTIVVIVDGQRRAMLTERGANTILDPAWVSDELLAGSRVLHITGHTLLNAAGAEGVASLISRARSAGVTVTVAPGSAGFIADYGPGRFLAAMAGADILFPSLEEGRLLTGLDSPEEIVDTLDFPVVVLTLGAAGLIVRHAGGSTGVHAVTTPVADPTGAGDAFCAGFLDAWVRTGDPVEAARAGAVVASRAVALIGGRPRP
ncbi:PfkB family carbohydrate kinase [soil metagenome]